MIPDDELMLVCRIAARRATFRWRQRDRDGGDYVAGAYLGIRRLLEKDPCRLDRLDAKHRKRLLLRAASFGITDLLMEEEGKPSSSKRKMRRGVLSLDRFYAVTTGGNSDDAGFVCYARTVPDREPVPPVEHRLLAHWCDTRDTRRGMPMIERLTAYLCYVERLTFEEVGRLLGVTGTAIWHRLYGSRSFLRRQLGITQSVLRIRSSSVPV